MKNNLILTAYGIVFGLSLGCSNISDIANKGTSSNDAAPAVKGKQQDAPEKPVEDIEEAVPEVIKEEAPEEDIIVEDDIDADVSTIEPIEKEPKEKEEVEEEIEEEPAVNLTEDNYLVELAPLDVTFFIDNSGSMNDNFALIQEELEILIDGLMQSGRRVTINIVGNVGLEAPDANLIPANISQNNIISTVAAHYAAAEFEPGTQVEAILISDDNNNGEGNRYTDFDAMTGEGLAVRVHALGAVASVNGCNVRFASSNIMQLAANTDGLSLDICNPDFEKLGNALLVSPFVFAFRLSQAPKDQEKLMVMVDGQLLPVNFYLFNPIDNLLFIPGLLLAEGSEVSVKYESGQALEEIE